MIKYFKKLAIITSVVFSLFLSVSVSHAATWWSNGIQWSDTCINYPTGVYFVFYNSPAPVGTACSWQNNYGQVFYGYMG